MRLVGKALPTAILAGPRRGSWPVSEGAIQWSGNELSQVLGPAAVREAKFVSLGVAPTRNELDLLETHRTPWPRTAGKVCFAPMTTRRGNGCKLSSSDHLLIP